MVVLGDPLPSDGAGDGVVAHDVVVGTIAIARERRAARLKEESHADAEFDPDHHVPRVKLGVACWGCNVVGADVEWYQHDLKEVPEGIGICMTCMDDTVLGRNLLLQLKVALEERQNSQ